MNQLVPDDRLLHTARNHHATIPAFLDDYACLIDGLIELYQSSFDDARIDQAVRLANRMLENFRDAENGGFFYTATDQPTPMTRIKDSQDGAAPCGNAMAATALLKLGALTGQTEFQAAAESVLRLLDGQLRRHPMSGGQSIIAIDHLLGSGVVVVIQSQHAEAGQSPLLRQLRARFAPGLLVVWRGAEHDSIDVSPVAHLFAERHAIAAADETAWVCDRGRGRCCAPLTSPDELSTVIDQVQGRPLVRGNDG